MQNSKDITYGAAAAAIALVFLFLTHIFVFNKAFFLAAATFVFSALSLLRNKKTAVISFVAAAVLAFALHPDKMLAFGFGALGVYSLIKSNVEHIRDLRLAWAVKFALYFAAAASASVIFFKTLLGIPILTGALFFVAYDAALTLGTGYFAKRFSKII